MIELNCLTCGICCMCEHAVNYRVIIQFGDEQYIPKDWIIDFDRGSRPYRAIKTKINSQGLNVCFGLDGEIGKEVKCLIHETKPQACRRFPVGSPVCLQARKKLSQVTKLEVQNGDTERVY